MRWKNRVFQKHEKSKYHIEENVVLIKRYKNIKNNISIILTINNDIVNRNNY